MFPAREIEDLLCSVIESKIKNLDQPDVTYKPFYTPLLGKRALLTHQTVQSIFTTFGVSVFEKVAYIVAQTHFDEVIPQYKLSKTLTKQANDVISNLLDDLRNKRSKPNAKLEFNKLRNSTVSLRDSIERDTVKVDLLLRRKREVFLIDVKTVKPNKSGILDYKRQILEWTAQGYAQFGTKCDIKSAIAMPYNPYHPEPYIRLNIDQTFDIDGGQLLVGEHFWNFLAGSNIYDELVATFERAGTKVKPMLHTFFDR